MLSVTRALTPEEMVSAVNWMKAHDASCPIQSVNKYVYDHDSALVQNPGETYRGLRITLRCKCGKFKELGTK